MKVYAVLNQKGGSGKTTTAVNLSAALAGADRPALLIDLDSQGDSTRWLDRWGPDGLYSALTGEKRLSEAIEGTDVEGLDLIPATDRLLTLEGNLDDRKALSRELDDLGDRWELALIDCPPALNDLTVSALAAADGLLVPVQCRGINLNGLGRMLKTVDAVKKNLNPELEISAVIPNQLDRRARHSGDVLENLRERFNGKLTSPVRENIDLAEAPTFKEPVTDYAPRSRGAEDFRKIADELIERGEL